MEDNGKITFIDEDGQKEEFYVIEETTLGNIHYLLVTDTPDEVDADAYIMKDVSGEDDETAVYEFVDDDRELEAVSDVFAELLDDIDLEK